MPSVGLVDHEEERQEEERQQKSQKTAAIQRLRQQPQVVEFFIAIVSHSFIPDLETNRKGVMVLFDFV